ncbi:MAG: 50S ribosomal protein L24 [Nitrospirota bacterium]
MAIQKCRIKKGDMVIVVSGKEKGKRGKVLQVLRKKEKALVERVNIVKRHTKESQQSKGGIIEREGLIHISNIMLICNNCEKTTRIGMKITEDGKKLRECKRCGEIIDKG